MITPTEVFGLKVQRLPGERARVLVIAETVALRNGTKHFRVGEINATFDGLNLPRASNISARLAELRKDRLTVKKPDGRWALTPLGRVAASEFVGQLDVKAIEIEMAFLPGANLGHAVHSVISPNFAPQKWAEPIARLLSEFPFERNVFCMTRYPRDPGDPIAGVIATAREALGKHGLIMHLASDQQLDDDVLGNVNAFMWACQYGIGLLDAHKRRLNYNVVIELGAMMMTGRRCALLRDENTTPKLPTDFVGQIYKPVTFEALDSVEKSTHAWAATDLGLGLCSDCA